MCTEFERHCLIIFHVRYIDESNPSRMAAEEGYISFKKTLNNFSSTKLDAR